jgi:hypothetical protein
MGGIITTEVNGCLRVSGTATQALTFSLHPTTARLIWQLPNAVSLFRTPLQRALGLALLVEWLSGL